MLGSRPTTTMSDNIIKSPALWAHCPGCPESKQKACGEVMQCGQSERLKWKVPTSVIDLDAYTEEMCRTIFYARKEMRRHQETLARLEPVFDKLVKLQEHHLLPEPPAEER
jgi:hypothetical protein